MCLIYGNVMVYMMNEGKYMGYLIDFDGVVVKEDLMNLEFQVDLKMKDMWMKKDFGLYVDKKIGKLLVNFLINNDIIGGNLGFLVINGDGQLIGMVFDGNWEVMFGDINFELNFQCMISFDVCYMLWIVDKVYGVYNLIEEMKIVK